MNAKELSELPFYDMKRELEKELTLVNIKFAFNKEQGDKILEELKPTKDNKLVSIAGGYMLRSDVHQMEDYYEKSSRAMLLRCQDDKKLKEALRYEFSNHECQITSDWDEGIDALGLDDDFFKSEERTKVLEDAKKEFWDYCCDNDCF